jgi:hypothetical protein
MVYRQLKQQIPPLRCGMTNKKTETLYTNVNFALVHEIRGYGRFVSYRLQLDSYAMARGRRVVISGNGGGCALGFPAGA